MSYSFVTGNLLDSPADALVCTVNCVGTMGKGLALDFKQRWPDLFTYYRQCCKGIPGRANPEKAFRPAPGWVLPWSTDDGRLVFCAATKDHWRDPSQLAWVSLCLTNLVILCDRSPWTRSIAIPTLGCGLGGLDWTLVRPMIVRAFQDHPCHAYIYGEPGP